MLEKSCILPWLGGMMGFKREWNLGQGKNIKGPSLLYFVVIVTVRVIDWFLLTVKGKGICKIHKLTWQQQQKKLLFWLSTECP